MELLESVRVSLTMILAIAAERPSGVSRAEGVDDEVDGEVVLEDGERGTQVVRGVRIVMVMVIRVVRVRGRCILVEDFFVTFVYSIFCWVWGVDVCGVWCGVVLCWMRDAYVCI